MAPLDYIGRGWPIFPCHITGRASIESGRWSSVASMPQPSTEIRSVIGRRWPKALIGLPTGRTSDTVVLDIDVKRADTNGLDTLAELGCAILPDTPLVHTASGGLHLYFEPPSPLEIRNTGGKRGHGIGAGLDWRGEGGYVILPSQGSGYWWDPHQNLDTVPLAPVPAALLPRKLERITASSRPIRPTAGLSPYADRALDSACRKSSPRRMASRRPPSTARPSQSAPSPALAKSPPISRVER